MLEKFAHVKWFNNPSPAHEAAFSLAELTVVAMIVIAGLFVLRFIDLWLKQKKIIAEIDKRTKPFSSWVPLIVRLSTATLLLINIAQDYLLAPNVSSSSSAISNSINIIFGVTAALLALGLFTEVAAMALLVGYLLVFKHSAAIDVLDHFEYVGIAGYLWLRGPGKHSLDNYFRKGKLAVSKGREHSLNIYRIGVGIGLATLALSEKIFNVSAAQDFLNQYDWNIVSFAGVSDRNFILVAGAIELLVGIALILNHAPRLLVTVVLLLMITTAIVLGIDEIYGHLFAVGLVAAIWVNDQKPAKNS